MIMILLMSRKAVEDVKDDISEKQCQFTSPEDLAWSIQVVEIPQIHQNVEKKSEPLKIIVIVMVKI